MPAVKVQFEFRNDTAANWASVNPVLAEGEPGVDIDSGNIKVGDGVTPWNDLTFPVGSQGPAGQDGAPGTQGPPGTPGADGDDGDDAALYDPGDLAALFQAS